MDAPRKPWRFPDQTFRSFLVFQLRTQKKKIKNIPCLYSVSVLCMSGAGRIYTEHVGRSKHEAHWLF